MGYCQSKNDQQRINILSVSDNQIRSDLQIEVDVFKYPKHDFVMRQNREITDQKTTKRKRYLRFDVDQTEYVEISFPVFQYLSQSLSAQLANFQIVQVFSDEINMDKCLYLTKRNQKQYCLSIRKFNSYNDQYAYQIANQIFNTQRISLFDSNHLHKISHSYTIQPSNELISNYSQLIFMEPVTTNLSFIIKNRRNNEICWTLRQFIDLMKQLIQAVGILHKNWFAHNDIRPSNIYYNLDKNCYCLGSFSNAKIVLQGAPSLNRRRKQSTQYHQMDRLSRDLAKIDIDGQMEDFKADVYALGMTFLSAFYLCEPIDRKKCAPFSRQLAEVYPILKIIKGMLTNQEHRLTINETKNMLLEYQNSIECLQQPIQFIQKCIIDINHLDSYKRQISIAQGYKSLGIIKSWKEKLNDRLLHQKIAEQSLQSAKYFGQLAMISHLQGNLQKWKSYYMRSAEIYHLIGTNNFKERDYSQAIFYFQNNLECLSKIKMQKNNILYLRDSLSLYQAKIVSGFELVSIQHLQSLEKMVIEMEIINTPQYCIFLQQLVNIYTYVQNYFKADKYLNLLLQKSQQTRSPCNYINIEKQIIQNNIKIISLQSSDNNKQDSSIRLKSTHQKITKIMNQLQYYLIEHPIYNMQILFFDAKLTLIKDPEGLSMLKNVESQIRDWIAHFCKLNAAQFQYQFYLLHAQVLEEIADYQIKTDIDKSLYLYIEAFRVYKTYFGNLYNIQCALIVQKIGNIYLKKNQQDLFSDCFQLFHKILKSTYGHYNKHILRIGAQISLQSSRTIQLYSKNQFYAKFQQWQDNNTVNPK